MAKQQNTFAKRQREMEKKRKAEDKKARRQIRKTQVNAPITTDESVPADQQT